MIAITGATGFLGGHFLNALQERQIPSTVLLRSGSPRESKLSRFTCKRATVDFADPESLRQGLEGAEILVHILGLINGTEESLRQSNVEITKNLAEAAGEAGIKKIIFISSAAAIHPHGTYGKTKARAEEFIKTSGVPYLIFRPAFIYGDGDENTTGMMIRALKRLPVVPLLGGGNFKLQPVFIEDVISLLVQGLFFSRVNSTYTVAGPEQVPLKNMLEILTRHLKIRRVFIPISLKPVQAFLRFFYFLFKHTRLPVKQILELDKHEAFDISDTRRDFQFDPMPFEEGVQRMSLT